MKIAQLKNYIFQLKSRYLYGIRGKEALLSRYSDKADKLGFKELFAVLSFDCDTQEDIEVVVPVHRRLVQMGIKPVYAVPGQLLLEGKEEYLTILREGGEFINHGYYKHTYFDETRQRYASCFFYEYLPPEIIAEDILKGHETLIQVLGVEAKGFRTPHFGTFQLKKQLQYLHEVLNGLGYEFSSSTVPYYAFVRGLVFENNGMLEIPVSGMYSNPLKILDSWSCFEAPGRKIQAKDYYNEIIKIIVELKDRKINGLLNYYVDPSHVNDSSEFFEAARFIGKNCNCTNYSNLIKLLAF